MAYALLRDTLTILFLGLTGLFTIENILPTFVSLHINLAYPVALSVFLLLALVSLARHGNIRYPSTLHPPAWFSILLVLWMLGIITNALLAFHTFSLVIILLLTATSLFLLARNFAGH